MSTCASARAALKRQVLSGAIPDAFFFFAALPLGVGFLCREYWVCSVFILFMMSATLKYKYEQVNCCCNLEKLCCVICVYYKGAKVFKKIKYY